MLIIAAYLAHAWAFAHAINDDAHITFRYSLNLATGAGPYFNPGEHVEGYTNFLLMLVVAAAIRVAGPDVAPLTAKLAGILGGVIAMLACYTWTRRRLALFPTLKEHTPLFAWAPPLMIAVSSAFALNAVTGLETALFAGLLALGAAQVDRTAELGRWSAAGVALALAALTRPEGVLAGTILLLAAFATARRARRALIVDAGLFAAAVIGHITLRFMLYDGEFVPNTYYAKTGGPTFDPRAGGYLWAFAAEHLGGPFALLPLCILVGPWAGAARPLCGAIAVCLLALGQTLHTGPDWMLGFRPLVQYLPIWSVLAVLGVAAAVARLRSRHHARIVGVIVLAAVAATLIRVDVRAALQRDVTNAAHGYTTGHLALADWLRADANTGDTVALMDIGLVGFHNPALRILDISGLTDRHIAHSPGGLFQKEYDPAYVIRQAPRSIVLVTTRPRDGDTLGPLVALTPMEGRIANHPDFRAAYIRPARPPVGDDDCNRIAALLGAVRVFNHADPKHVYLLSVYERRPD